MTSVFRGTARSAAGILCLSGLILSVFSTAAAQSTSSSATDQASTTKAAIKQAAPDGKASPSSNLRKLVDTHKVITTEDLEKTHSKPEKEHDLEKVHESPASDPAVCDAECAAEARNEIGMGLSQEGEWQAQFTTAKHNLAADAGWRNAYADGFRKVQMYCTFLDQQRKAPPPSGNDFQSQFERAKQDQYISDMDHTLSAGVQGVRANMNRMIDAAQRTEPVRAAIMRVLAQRIFDQCASSYDP